MSKIPKVALETWKDLCAAAVRFADRRLWDRLEDSSVFGVRDPVSGQMGYACVLGALGEMMALCVYRGDEGWGHGTLERWGHYGGCCGHEG